MANWFKWEVILCFLHLFGQQFVLERQHFVAGFQVEFVLLDAGFNEVRTLVFVDLLLNILKNISLRVISIYS